jgi:5,10-methenyltetrahydromethanopterin hydrogenase
MYNFKFKKTKEIKLAMFDYRDGKLFKVLGNCWGFKQETIEFATQELISFMGENGCNNKVEAVYNTACQSLIIRSKI